MLKGLKVVGGCPSRHRPEAIVEVFLVWVQGNDVSVFLRVDTTPDLSSLCF